MGYRSDVAYVIRFEDDQTMKQFVTQALLIDPELKEAINECKVYKGGQVYGTSKCPEIYFREMHTKWYNQFPDVQLHLKLLELIDDEVIMSTGVAHRFIRIGEEDDDIEQTYGGDYDLVPWDSISLHRDINLDGGRDERDKDDPRDSVTYLFE